MDMVLDKAKLYIKDNKFYIGTYIFFFLICILTPISGDDYMNYVRGQQGLLEILNITKEFYLTWEGRIISRIIILLFTPRKFLWNIITPFLFVLCLKSLTKIEVFKNKYSYLFLLLSVILVNISMFAQTYTWLAGSITYLYPTSLTIYYFVTLYKNIDNQLNAKQIILLSILALIIPMFTENIGCAFVFGNFLFIIYRYYLKKETKINWLFLILSSLSLASMLLSPGSAVRAIKEGAFYSLTLFEKLRVNILYCFFKYTITMHTTLLILMLTCCNIYLKKVIKKKYKIILIVLFNIIPIITIIQNILNIANESYQICFFPYWILFCGIFILSLINNYKDNKKLLLFYCLLLLIAFSSMLCMLPVGYWFERISILFVFIVSFISIGIIDKNIKIDNSYVNIIKIILISCMIWLILCMFSTYKIDKYRIKYIQEQKESNTESIEVIYQLLPYIWIANLQEEYFVDTYKQYQDIDENISLTIKKLSLKEYIQIIFSK